MHTHRPEDRNLLVFDRHLYGRLGQSAPLPARAQRALVRWAFKDDLTGLLNRRGFRVLARRRISTATRRGRAILLFFADLDGFKWINDTHGHSEGDRALARTATSLRKTFRRTDVIARFGGDEFVALVTEEPGCSADALCARLVENLAKCASGQRRYNLSLSVGVARFGPDCVPTLRKVLEAADEQLYRTKHERQRSAVPSPRRPILATGTK